MGWLFLVIGIALVVFLVYAFCFHGKRKLTYAEAMKYFVEQRKLNPKAVKGSIIKQKVSGGYVITQSLLDKDGNVLRGSKMTVSGFDDELLALFKDNNVIIVE